MSHSTYNAAPCEVCLAEDPSENDKTGWGLLDEHVDSRLTQAYITRHLLVYVRTKWRGRNMQKHISKCGHYYSQLLSATSPDLHASGV